MSTVRVEFEMSPPTGAELTAAWNDARENGRTLLFEAADKLALGLVLAVDCAAETIAAAQFRRWRATDTLARAALRAHDIDLDRSSRVARRNLAEATA